MDTPLCIQIDDMKREIAKIVNGANLPPCVFEPILKDLYEEAHAVALEELKAAREKQEVQNG